MSKHRRSTIGADKTDSSSTDPMCFEDIIQRSKQVNRFGGQSQFLAKQELIKNRHIFYITNKDK